MYVTDAVLRRLRARLVDYALRTVLVLGAVLLVLLALAPRAHGQPIFVAEFDGGRVTLTDEPCDLKAITNAPKRVTWLERNGSLTEGCYGIYTLRLTGGKIEIIVGYFADLTLQVLPLAVFNLVRAI